MNLLIGTPFLAFTIILIYFFYKKYDQKNSTRQKMFGPIEFSIGMLFIIFLFYASWLMMYYMTECVYDISMEGQKYTGTVVKLTDNPPSSDGETSLPTATILFITKEGKTLKKQLDFSSGQEAGQTYDIYYIKSKDKVFPYGGILFARIVLAYIFCFMMTYLFAFITANLFSKQKADFGFFTKTVFFHFTIMVMIGFTIIMMRILL